MATPDSLAKTAREKLAQALNALQTSGDAPVFLLDLAEPIAQSMAILHKIERSNGADLTGKEQVSTNVRAVLDKLQTAPENHPAVDQVMEFIAGSLSSVHQLARATPVAAPVPAAAPAPAPAPVPAAPAAAPAPSGPPPGFAQPPAFAAAPAGVSANHAGFQTQPIAPAPAANAFGGSPHQTVRMQSPVAVAPQAQPAPQYQPAPQPQPQVQPAPQPQPIHAQPQPQFQPTPAVAFQPAPAPTQALRPQPSQPSAAARAPQPSQPGGNVLVELGAHSASNFYKGLGGNDVIEHGGIFVATYKIPKLGTQVTLRVLLPGDYEFQASGTVQWIRESGGGDAEPGFGARLTQITPEGRQLVYRYTRNREPMFYDDL